MAQIENTKNKGKPNGYAGLDRTGKVSASAVPDAASAWLSARFASVTLADAATSTLALDPASIEQAGDCFEPDNSNPAGLYILKDGLYQITVELMPAGALPATEGDLLVSAVVSGADGGYFDGGSGIIAVPHRAPLTFHEALCVFPAAPLLAGDYDGYIEIKAAYTPAAAYTIDPASSLHIVRVG